MSYREVDDFLEDLTSYGMEQAVRRWYSLYRGRVKSIEDSDGLARILVDCPLISDADHLPIQAWPITPFAGDGFGFFFPPEKDELVYVGFFHGDVDRPFYIGGWWAAPGGKSQLPSEVQDIKNPTTRLIKTKVGHMLLFEDSEEQDEPKRVILRSGKDLDTQIHVLEMVDKDDEKRIRLLTEDEYFLTLHDKDQYAQLATPGGYSLKLDEKNKNNALETPSGYKITVHEEEKYVEITTPGSNLIKIDDNGNSILLSDATGNTYKLSPTGIEAESLGLIDVRAQGPISTTTDATLTEDITGAKSTTAASLAVSLASGAISFTAASASAMALTAGSATLTMTLAGLAVVAGAIGAVTLGGYAARKLVDERFLLVYNANVALFNGHTHISAGVPGVPTSGPNVPQAIAALAAVATQKTIAE